VFTADDLVPTPASPGPHQRFTIDRPLLAGWYAVRIGASSQLSANRKRLELTFDGDTPVREAFAWTDRLDEAFTIHLPNGATRIRLDVWEAAGELKFHPFEVRRLSAVRRMIRATTAKLRLVTSHHCFGPALGRAVRLAVRGRFRELFAKLDRGLTDTRTMLPETAKADDVPVVWSATVQVSVSESGPRVILATDLRGVGGYDRVGFAWLTELLRHGFDVRMHPANVIRDDLVPPSLRRPTAHRTDDSPRLVVGPPFRVAAFDPDARTAIYTMWESDTLLPEWVKVLNRAGVVIVPSRWQRECFRKDGVTTRIEVVPLGYDPEVFPPTAADTGPCTFGTAGALNAGGVRKNVQQVIDVFRRAFPTESDVRLRVKLTPGSPMPDTGDDPRIEVLRAVLPPAELADWYRSLTAYLNLSAGEGYGLHLLEAMACGRPLVSPYHSGLTAFFDATVGYPVDFTLVPVTGTDVYTGRWAAANEESALARLRQVYRDREEANRFGRMAAERAAGFTWQVAGRQLIGLIGGLGSSPRTIDFTSPEGKAYKLAAKTALPTRG
jgi:glycosyltransferase involved in cell wall biosynthesis